MLLICCVLLIIILYLLNTNNYSEQFKNIQEYIPRIFQDPVKLIKYKKNNPNNDIQSNRVYSANLRQIKKQNQRMIYSPIKEKFKVKINHMAPITQNKQTIYKLYGEDNLNFKKAGIIQSNKDIDQTTNINIMNHTNNGTGKTIKELYDEITNDNRNQNIDNVEPFDSQDNYVIETITNYGSTGFNTY